MTRGRRASAVDAAAGELICSGEARGSEHAGRRTHLKELLPRHLRERRAWCRCSWHACVALVMLQSTCAGADAAGMRAWC